MANADSAFGLKPIGHLMGIDWNQNMRVYYVPSSDSTAIYKGDLVTHGGTAEALGEYPTVKQTAAGDTTIVGVAWAFSNTPYIGADTSTLTRDYRPASTAMYVHVIVDPFVIYECQEDSDSDTLAITDIGQTANVVVGSGSTTTGLSGMEINTDDTGATGNLKILRLAKRDDGSNVLGTNAIWEVMINEHYFKLDAGA